VILALNGIMQNDGDLVNLIILIHAAIPGEEIVQTATIRRHGRDGAMVPAAD
jgi:hypothetical protein